MTLFDPVTHQVFYQQDEVVINLIGHHNHVADIILPGVHFMPLFGQCRSFSIWLLISISLPYKFRSQGMGCCLLDFAGSTM
jgi:hypothetical protein